MSRRRLTQEKAVFGVPTSALFLGIGIASLVVSLQDRSQTKEPDCGEDGAPPLRDYLLGTGISFVTIGLSFVLASLGKKIPLLSWVLGVANTFLFCWIIVGCVSLWRDGQDCQELNPKVYKMGMAAVISSMLICCCGGFTSYYVVTGDADNEVV